MPDNYHARYDQSRFRAGRRAPHESGVRRLARAVPGLLASYDDRTGMPVQLTIGAGRPVTRLGAGRTDPAGSAIAFVADRADLWDLAGADLRTVEVTSVSSRGVRLVRLRQRAGGVEIFGSQVNVGLSARNEVSAVAGQFFPGARGLTGAGDPVGAVRRALADLTGQDPAARGRAGAEGRGGYLTVEVPGRLSRPARAKKVLFPLGGGEFRAAWYVEVWPVGLPPFSYVVDPADPRPVLLRNCLRSDLGFDYHVHNTNDRLLRPEDSPAPGTPHPTGTPDDQQAPAIAERWTTVDSLIGDPWLPPDATTTSGNNCSAYADVDAPDGRTGPGDVSGQVTAPGAFGWSYDHGESASSAGNLQSGLTALFFLTNWAHDRWYAAGFDEAAGNGQQDNFGRGGHGGDPVRAEANDWDHPRGGIMDTPADGDSPTLQVGVFPDPSPDRTGCVDAHVVLHELAHYLTNRMIGDGSGLPNWQGYSLGEGWADLLALCMTSQPGDDFRSGTFGLAGWCSYLNQGNPDGPGRPSHVLRDNYYFGLRRYPYSVRMDRSPLTFRHLSKGEPLPVGPPTAATELSGKDNPETHHAGEIWAAALWEVFVNLIDRHGHTQAERRMLHYLVGGLAFTPTWPTYVQAREGFLAAVTLIDVADLRAAWTGFAKRGLGMFAIAPPSDSTTHKDLIEDFTVPWWLPDPPAVAVLCAVDQLL